MLKPLVKSAGFTLMECLVAIALAGLICSMAISLYLFATKQSFSTNRSWHLLQESRLVKAMLTQSIEMAGYSFCASQNPVVMTLHEITIKGNDHHIGVIKHITMPNQIVVEGLSPRFKSGESILLTDCTHQYSGRVNRVTTSFDLDQQRINLEPYFRDNIHLGEAVLQPQTVSYFLIGDVFYQKTVPGKTIAIIRNMKSLEFHAIGGKAILVDFTLFDPGSESQISTRFIPVLHEVLGRA